MEQQYQQQNSIAQGPEHLRKDPLPAYELRINPTAAPDIDENYRRLDHAIEEQYSFGPPTGP